MYSSYAQTIFYMHAKVRQGAILEIFGLLNLDNELMKQI